MFLPSYSLSPAKVPLPPLAGGLCPGILPGVPRILGSKALTAAPQAAYGVSRR